MSEDKRPECGCDMSYELDGETIHHHTNWSTWCFRNQRDQLKKENERLKTIAKIMEEGHALTLEDMQRQRAKLDDIESWVYSLVDLTSGKTPECPCEESPFPEIREIARNYMHLKEVIYG